MSDLRDAIDRAYGMPASPAQVDALELLARQAEQRNDPEISIYALQYLYYAAFKSMLVERMLATYTKMRAIFDRHAARLPRETAALVAGLGQNALYIVDGIPEISRAQIDELFADVERAATSLGMPRHGLLSARLSSFVAAGYTDRARELYEQLQSLRPDPNACEACRIGRTIWFLIELERPEEAIEAAQPIVRGGMKCENQPAGAWAQLMIPHARRNEWDLARAYHARLHRSVLAKPGWVGDAAACARFAAVDHAYTKGKNVIERSLPHALADASKSARCWFFNAVAVWLDGVARARTTVTLALPATHPLHDASGRYQIAPLRAWFANASEDIARMFDRRNGNTHWIDELAKAGDALALTPPG